MAKKNTKNQATQAAKAQTKVAKPTAAELSQLTPEQTAKRDEMLTVIKACTPQSLEDLQYKILFPGDDILTQTVLANAPENMTEVLSWLTTPDAITRALYPSATAEEAARDAHPDRTGEVIKFPFTENVNKTAVQPFIGHLGDQDSKFHQETTVDHTNAVYQLAQEIADRPDEFTHAVLDVAAILHDVGKKYTTATNKNGELCFYGHAELSAYIAGLWLIHGKLTSNWPAIDEFMRLIHGEPATISSATDRFIWLILIIIFEHMEIKTTPKLTYPQKFYQRVAGFYTNNAEPCQVPTILTYQLLLLLNEADTKASN